MAMENIHIWFGAFNEDAPKDYFDKTGYDEEDDDLPISQFAGEQNETWLDHDWMEHYWYDELKPITEFAKGNLLNSSCKKLLLKNAEKIGLAEANVFVVIDADEVSNPQSVHQDTYKLYYMGLYENKQEPLSIEELTKKSENGCSKSQAMLGGISIFPAPGQEHLIDHERAEYWLLKAAEQGETSPYNRLYHLYYSYSETLHDLEKAFFWIRKAAQIGWATDQYYLAQLYEKGEGVEQNKIKALKWYFLYACQDDRSPSEDFVNLVNSMSEDDIQKAEQLALNWIEEKNYDTGFFHGMKQNPLNELK